MFRVRQVLPRFQGRSIWTRFAWQEYFEVDNSWRSLEIRKRQDCSLHTFHQWSIICGLADTRSIDLIVSGEIWVYHFANPVLRRSLALIIRWIQRSVPPYATPPCTWPKPECFMVDHTSKETPTAKPAPVLSNLIPTIGLTIGEHRPQYKCLAFLLCWIFPELRVGTRPIRPPRLTLSKLGRA